MCMCEKNPIVCGACMSCGDDGGRRHQRAITSFCCSSTKKKCWPKESPLLSFGGNALNAKIYAIGCVCRLAIDCDRPAVPAYPGKLENLVSINLGAKAFTTHRQKFLFILESSAAIFVLHIHNLVRICHLLLSLTDVCIHLHTVCFCSLSFCPLYYVWNTRSPFILLTLLRKRNVAIILYQSICDAAARWRNYKKRALRSTYVILNNCF